MFKTHCNGLNYLGSRCKRFPFDNPTVKKQQYGIKSYNIENNSTCMVWKYNSVEVIPTDKLYSMDLLTSQ